MLSVRLRAEMVESASSTTSLASDHSGFCCFGTSIGACPGVGLAEKKDITLSTTDWLLFGENSQSQAEEDPAGVDGGGKAHVVSTGLLDKDPPPEVSSEEQTERGLGE